MCLQFRIKIWSGRTAAIIVIVAARQNQSGEQLFEARLVEDLHLYDDGAEDNKRRRRQETGNDIGAEVQLRRIWGRGEDQTAVWIGGLATNKT